MLTEEKLSDLCRQHRLGDFAIATVRTIRKSDPSRIVRSGTHNVVTHYASRKMGCVIKAEASQTELAAIYEWDHDKNTYEFYDQPPQIKKIHSRESGRPSTTRYTPDFFLLAEDFIGWVECKPEGWLLEQAEKPQAQYVRDVQGQWRCPSAEAYAHSVGLGFAVRSSSASDSIVTQNIADLSDYYRDDCPIPTRAQQQAALLVLGKEGWCWLRDLIGNDVGLTADVIYKLIADEGLHVDLHAFTLMNEPHRVRVFSTRALMDSSELWLKTDLPGQELVISQVEMVAGTPISWDGEAYEVLNVGQTEVYLRKVDGSMLSLPIDVFEKLAKTGMIVGAHVAVDPRIQLTSERLRAASSEDMKAAMHRYYCIHPERCPPGERHTASSRAIRKWNAMARKGYSAYGNEFIGLLPTISERGNRERRFDGRTLKIMHEVIQDKYMAKESPGLFSCWSSVVTACEKDGLLPPSKKSFRAEIDRVTTPEVLKKAREGEKAGYDLEMPYVSLNRETPRHGTRPFDVAHIDHTELDLQFVNESNGSPMGKAWVTVMIDAFTRVILAWILTFNAPSYRSCMLVMRDCVRRHGRVPRTVVADQGREFKCTYFDQLLAYLGMHKRMRPASHPRFGSILERFFGVQNTEFTHVLRGNNKALQTPRRMSPSHDPRNLAVWNLRAFREGFEGFLTNVYHPVEHPALGISPAKGMELGMLQAGARSHTLIAYDRNFVIATLPAGTKDTAKIQRDGSFKVNRIDYFSATLIVYAGQQLEVKYDPFDFSRAYAMGKSGWIEAISTHAGFLAGRTEKEIEAISLEIDEINKRDGIREKDRARALGAYLRTVHIREAVLSIEVQRARDRELRASDADVGLLDVPSEGNPNGGGNVLDFPQHAKDKVVQQAVLDTAFENISEQTFEDF